MLNFVGFSRIIPPLFIVSLFCVTVVWRLSLIVSGLPFPCCRPTLLSAYDFWESLFLSTSSCYQPKLSHLVCCRRLILADSCFPWSCRSDSWSYLIQTFFSVTCELQSAKSLSICANGCKCLCVCWICACHFWVQFDRCQTWINLIPCMFPLFLSLLLLRSLFPISAHLLWATDFFVIFMSFHLPCHMSTLASHWIYLH